MAWTYFASSTKAIIPEAKGVADDVPLKSLMHVSLFPVVVCKKISKYCTNRWMIFLVPIVSIKKKSKYVRQLHVRTI